MTKKKLLYYDFNEFRLDNINGQLLKDGKSIILTQKSLEILQYLIKHRGRLLRKKELLNSVWSDTFVEESTLTQHIYMLRKALKENSLTEPPIETVPKNGYRFIGQVNEVFEQEITKNYSDEFGIPTLLESSAFEINQLPAVVPDNIPHFIEPTPNIRTKSLFVITSLVSLILTLVIFFYFSNQANGKANPPSIVVLPFQQINGNKEDRTGLGMADILISKLGKLENIRVTPTSSIISYSENEDLELFEVGEKLQADAVLWGTVQKDNDTVRVTFQLYCIKSKHLLLSETIDGKYENLFSMQDKISAKVIQYLSATIKKGQTIDDSQYTKNVEAFNSYSRGLFYWNKRSAADRIEAAKHFQTALDKDPEFVLAYAYLADTYSLASYYNEKIIGLSGSSLLSHAKLNAQKALDLDPNCAEALAALSVAYSAEFKDIEAFNLLRKALELKPNYATAHQRIAWLFAVEGNLEKAIEESGLALSFDSQAQAPNLAMAAYLNMARKPDESLIYSQKALAIDNFSKSAKGLIAESYEQKGLYNNALEIYSELYQSEESQNGKLAAWLNLKRNAAKTSPTNVSKDLLTKMLSEVKAAELLFPMAKIYLALGNETKALDLLERLYKIQGKKVYPQIKYEYEFDSIKENPRFIQLLQQAEKGKG